MTAKESLVSETTIKIFRTIFFICAIYFFFMGIGLIFFPRNLIIGFSDIEVNPVIIGMLRGAGGSILPYTFLYITISIDPLKRLWALDVILLANIIAISLDLGSLLLREYKLSYVLIDIPVEMLSIMGIVIIRTSIGRAKSS